MIDICVALWCLVRVDNTGHSQTCMALYLVNKNEHILLY